MAQQPSASAGAPPAGPAPGADASAADHAAADIAIDAAYLAYGRAVWIGVVSGVAVGFLLGFVNRLIMRVVAVMNGPTPIETDFGAKVLNFTLEGTIFLIVATVIVSIVPGALYMVLRRLVPERGARQRPRLRRPAGGRRGDVDHRRPGEGLPAPRRADGLRGDVHRAVLRVRAAGRPVGDPTRPARVARTDRPGLRALRRGGRAHPAPRAPDPVLRTLGVAAPRPDRLRRRGLVLGAVGRVIAERSGSAAMLALAVPIVPGLIDLGQELSLIALA